VQLLTMWDIILKFFRSVLLFNIPLAVASIIMALFSVEAVNWGPLSLRGYFIDHVQFSECNCS